MRTTANIFMEKKITFLLKTKKKNREKRLFRTSEDNAMCS